VEIDKRHLQDVIGVFIGLIREQRGKVNAASVEKITSDFLDGMPHTIRKLILESLLYYKLEHPKSNIVEFDVFLPYFNTHYFIVKEPIGLIESGFSKASKIRNNIPEDKVSDKLVALHTYDNVDLKSTSYDVVSRESKREKPLLVNPMEKLGWRMPVHYEVTAYNTVVGKEFKLQHEEFNKKNFANYGTIMSDKRFRLITPNNKKGTICSSMNVVNLLDIAFEENIKPAKYFKDGWEKATFEEEVLLKILYNRKVDTSAIVKDRVKRHGEVYTAYIYTWLSNVKSSILQELCSAIEEQFKKDGKIRK
jgi:hypothetical protein